MNEEKEIEYECITKKEAAGLSYKPLTKPYKIFSMEKEVSRAHEKIMLNNVIADMEAGNIDYVLVAVPEGIEVHRSAMSMTSI